MAKVYIFLASGFEEIEALTVVDLLRRANIEVVMVSVHDGILVKGAHGIEVMADMEYQMDSCQDGDMLVLPGGMPGTNGLMGHEGLRELLFEYRNSGKLLAAICAAPSVLGLNGILKGKTATCYPGFEDKLLGAKAVNERVVKDGNVITSRGVGTAIDFALVLIEELADKAIAEKIAQGIQYR